VKNKTMNKKNRLVLLKLFFLVPAVTLVTQVCHSQALFGSLKDKMMIKKIKTIELRYDDVYVPLVWTSFDLQVEATLKNGKHIYTGNGTKNNFSWENYNIEVEGGTFSPETGKLEITNKDQVNISATLIPSPEISNKLSIRPLEVKGISLSHKQGPELGSFLLSAKATLSDNRTISSDNGSLQWEKLDISVAGANFSDGKLTLPEQDYRAIKDDKISLTAKVKGREGISDSLSIPMEYHGKIESYFNGERGRAGRDGKAGSAGKNGSAGSGERAGGDGGNGKRGADGGDGADGRNAEDLELYIELAKNTTNGNDILKVHVKSLSSGRESYLKIDPTKGELDIYAVGGKGGNGGRGGNGGNGGSGGGGTVSGKAGNGGDGGNGGNGGYGGDGGNVTVFVQPPAKKYMSSINIHNNGGRGGDMGSMGSGGACPNNCSHGSSGEFGDAGKSGASGSLDIKEEEVEIDW
jgi:hypothetical protein